MKALVIGDYLAPQDLLKQTFDIISDYVDEIQSIEWHSENREQIRKQIRNMEANGIEAEPPPEGLKDLIRSAQLVVVHNCPIAGKLIDSTESLQVIGTIRSGFDNIDIKAATKKGVAVLFTPDHNSVCTAEYALGLMLCETRNIARSHHALKGGVWRELYPNSANIPELNNSTVGIIGFGHIGRLVAGLVGAFCARILVSDPWVETREILKLGYQRVELDELLSSSDIVTLHARLAKGTRNLIGQKELAMMKPNSYLINTARAGLIDMLALETALRMNKIAGAAIDVFDKEPLLGSESILSLDNVTLSSHRAGDTKNAYWGAPTLLGRRMRDLLEGRKVDFIANPDVLVDRDFVARETRHKGRSK